MTKVEDSLLPVPAILEDTPSILRTIIRGFREETLQWRPNQERWSAAMVMTHLAEAEVVCFRARLRAAATLDCPVLEPYDQWAHLKTRADFPTYEALRSFEEERAVTVRFLRTLPRSVLARRCVHQKLGELTFENLLNEFAFHDMGHLRQILELCRSCDYYPNMGGWQNYYNIAP